jgi:glucokinase
MKAIGVDLGGSHVAAGVVGDDGKLLGRFEHDVVDRSFEAVAAILERLIKSALSEADSAVGIGIGSPGNVDAATGAIRYSPNFGWHDAPLGATIRSKFSAPVFVANDARCATLGEYVHGVGKGTKEFMLLTLGTGIGGGIVAGGSLVLGIAMGAGEVGHHQIRASDGFICGCGKRGCFEAQASGTGLLRHAFALAPSFPRSTMLDVPRDDLGTKKLRKAAQNGDGHAVAAWNAFCDDLSLGLANCVAFLNPEVIALGGGVASAGDFLLERVRPRVDTLTTMAPRGSTRIEIAQLGNDAGMIGAATMALRGGLSTRETVSA